MDGVEFLARADVENLQCRVSLAPLLELAGRDENLFVLLVALSNGRQNRVDIQVVIALANLFQSFARLKRTTAATANMILLEQRALGPRIRSEDFLHGRAARDGIVDCFHW